MNRDAVLNICTAPRTNSRHWEQATITWGSILDWALEPADRKESGDYLLGELEETEVRHKGSEKLCKNLHRLKRAVVSRSALTLDVDHPEDDLIENLLMLTDFAGLVHSTFNSAPDDKRYRIVIPTDRDMAPDEYVIAARAMMARLGYKQFDPTTDQPERYMYKPAARYPEWYEHWVLEGNPVSVDELLAEEFDEDLREVPFPDANKTKRDPFEIDGVVGAFNRAYTDLQLLIDEYQLPYEPDGEDRWHLIGARAIAGMGIIRDGLFYSHHASDPAAGKACTAFDLVRLHKYGDLDERSTRDTPLPKLPSYLAMQEAASIDARVTAELVGVDFTVGMDGTEEEKSGDWKLGFKLTPRTGRPEDVIHNWDLMRENDPVFLGLYYNELTMSVETEKDLPWRTLDEAGITFSGADRAALAHYLEREYRIRPARSFMDEMILIAAHSRYVNPIKDYLNSLSWDGQERVENCLPGVIPTEYTRFVARKCLVAAVARVMQPGCKWDHTLVIQGTEGLGKSFWIERLAKGWSASLGRVGDKDTLITMQRSWILVADEGHSLRKADADAIKEFLTRTVDVMRMPYDREARAYPRRSVIWSTINDEIFLRRQEGNRRFLVVRSTEKINFDLLTDSYIDQLWAEAVHLWRAGEDLYLDDIQSKNAAFERESFVEEDALVGIVQEYLNTLVPANWNIISPEARVHWLQSRDDDFSTPGTDLINEVCSLQIWVEALGRRAGEHRRVDLLEISKALAQVKGWTSKPGRTRIHGYGPQQVFVRDELEDLI